MSEALAICPIRAMPCDSCKYLGEIRARFLGNSAELPWFPRDGDWKKTGSLAHPQLGFPPPCLRQRQEGPERRAKSHPEPLCAFLGPRTTKHHDCKQGNTTGNLGIWAQSHPEHLRAFPGTMAAKRHPCAPLGGADGVPPNPTLNTDGEEAVDKRLGNAY
jgi:hypothetical protein